MKKLIIAACLLCTPAVAWAADLCEAVALHNIPATEAYSYPLKKGEKIDAVTQYRIQKKTGETSFCSHGGGCYPTHIQQEGHLVEALRLLNCNIGDEYSSIPDDEYRILSVNIDRKRNSKRDLRKKDVRQRLSEIGLCSACADNVAELYIKKPKSKCATVARKALEGDPDATAVLLDFPTYCTAYK